MLQYEYLRETVGFDGAQNEPSEFWSLSPDFGMRITYHQMFNYANGLARFRTTWKFSTFHFKKRKKKEETFPIVVSSWEHFWNIPILFERIRKRGKKLLNPYVLTENMQGSWCGSSETKTTRLTTGEASDSRQQLLTKTSSLDILLQFHVRCGRASSPKGGEI